jgi:L-Ala-D/L-Glu epimerase
MLITRVEVTPIEFKLRQPFRSVYAEGQETTGAVFVRVETRQGRMAWGCAAVDPSFTHETLEEATDACRRCAELAPDLNPLNIEFALAQLAGAAGSSVAARCAFDLAFYDLLGLAAGQPLYQLFGGFRHKIQTSITVGLGTVPGTVEQARERARQGFHILKIKGGRDPEEDVRRVQAVAGALPHHTLRLDAEQGYDIQQAIDVARALAGKLEMLEQPTAAEDLDALRQVSKRSPVPILADESVADAASALEIAGRHAAHGLSIKAAMCGGLHCSRQVDTIARAARLATMVGCVHEPALLTAAGLTLALSSPNVQYGDLDGHFDLIDDPTQPGFRFEEGWLVATDVPGLGCTVAL